MSTTVRSATEIRPFHATFQTRSSPSCADAIAAARWPSKELVQDRSQGVQLATLAGPLARYWETDYDWRKCGASWNALPQFTTEIDGVDIHFIHVKSQHEDALPLIITHGWHGLRDRATRGRRPAHGPEPRTADAPRTRSTIVLSVPARLRLLRRAGGDRLGPRAASRAPWAELMHRLGYTRYVAQAVTWAPSSPT